MITYIIIFTTLGFFLRFIVFDDSTRTIVFVVISIVWAFVWGIPWAIITLAELFLGAAIAKVLTS